MYAIVGLGNPGKKYEQTRHNLGFIAVDLIGEKLGVKINKSAHKALIGEARVRGEKVLLVKPQTFMNLSGESVRSVLDYYDIDPERLIVIYDDFDIALGEIRIRKKGSAGSHNGMRSIIYLLRDENFPRIRIGIGAETQIPLMSYVLGGFTKEEKGPLEKAVTRAAQAALTIVEEGVDRAMNEYNGKD